jgi:hypothetical protein
MATRKRKPADKKLPAFKLTRLQEEKEENDLKKVKARTIKELKENQLKEKEWFDNELDKNLKSNK